MKNTVDTLLEFIEEKGLMPELKVKLEAKPDDQVKYADIKTLLGTSNKRTDGSQLLEKFVDFMEESKGGTDKKEGIHIDAITTAQRGLKKNDAGWKKAKTATHNWLESRMVDKKTIKAIVGKVEGKTGTYYYIPNVPAVLNAPVAAPTGQAVKK